jgi:hypothetical protein
MWRAIHDGEDPFEVLGAFTTDLIKSMSQNVRYLQGHFDEEGTRRKEAFRDKRVFEELSGLKEPQPITKSNPYEDLAAKKFKKEEDLNVASEELPKLIQKALAKAGNNPEILAKEFEKLRRNSYQTLPSPDTSPKEFADYIAYLKKIKTPEEVNKIVQDYFRVNAINKARSEMVPNLR